jgi:hypothetical protein
MSLRELIEAVEAGDDDFVLSDSWIGAWDAVAPELQTYRMKSDGVSAAIVASKAYHGSLDAAMSLHKRVLGDGNISTPGYMACVWMSGKASVWDIISGNRGDGEVNDPILHEVSPARAWLLAILSAMEARDVKGE